MIKAFFFDFDGVLTTDPNGWTTLMRNFVSVTGLSQETIEPCYRACHEDLKNGKTTHAAVWDDLCACFGKSFEITVLDDIFCTIPLNTRMFDLCRKLSGAYRLGIITDNFADRTDAIEEKFDLTTLFGSVTVSAKVGHRKTEPMIFDAALSSLGVTPQESVFVDNQKKNLSVPQEMGFFTYYHDDARNNVLALEDQLVKWGVHI